MEFPTGVPVSVTSSNLSTVTYYPQSQTMVVEFNGGGIYSYSQVPISVYEDLLSASSKGSYFHYNVKWNFSYQKIA